LQIFANVEFGEVRIVEINDKPYFVGVDVARELGYASPNTAVRDHCEGGRASRPCPPSTSTGPRLSRKPTLFPKAMYTGLSSKPQTKAEIRT
jgi:prophage antirepressor-like protein